eukprot:1966083-Rhodomonas_salina.2
MPRIPVRSVECAHVHVRADMHCRALRTREVELSGPFVALKGLRRSRLCDPRERTSQPKG